MTDNEQPLQLPSFLKGKPRPKAETVVPSRRKTRSELVDDAPDLSVQEVIARFVDAREFVTRQEERFGPTGRHNDPDLAELYQSDGADYDILLELFRAGKLGEAVKKYWKMDTASRDYAFHNGEDLSLEKFLHFHYKESRYVPS